LPHWPWRQVGDCPGNRYRPHDAVDVELIVPIAMEEKLGLAIREGGIAVPASESPPKSN
jgi:translation elongation factor EF-Tu-like GTPase